MADKGKPKQDNSLEVQYNDVGGITYHSDGEQISREKARIKVGDTTLAKTEKLASLRKSMPKHIDNFNYQNMLGGTVRRSSVNTDDAKKPPMPKHKQ